MSTKNNLIEDYHEKLKFALKKQKIPPKRDSAVYN